MTDPKPNIYQRLNAVMFEATGVSKARYNEHQRYHFQGHADVTAAVRALYVKHGIVRSAAIVSVELNASHTTIVRGLVKWTNIDTPTDYHEVEMWAVVPSTSLKGPSATQTGVALSYLVKQAELKTLALTDDDTPDAAAEEQTRGQEKAQERTAEVNVGGLVHAFEKAQTESDLQAARDAVKRCIAGLTPAAREQLTAARDAAIQRINGWTDGAPQGRRT